MAKQSPKEKGAAEKKVKKTELSVAIPEGVTVSVDGGLVNIKGSKGEVSRRFPVDSMAITKQDNRILLVSDSKRKEEKAIVGSAEAHIRNMIHGVKDGILYKMKIVYSHFPMNVKVQGDRLMIDNFLGEKHPRRASIAKNVTVEVKGQDVSLKGWDKEAVSQTAANIEQITKIRERDLRVFQDGIYITEKDGKPVK